MSWLGEFAPPNLYTHNVYMNDRNDISDLQGYHVKWSGRITFEAPLPLCPPKSAGAAKSNLW